MEGGWLYEAAKKLDISGRLTYFTACQLGRIAKIGVFQWKYTTSPDATGRLAGYKAIINMCEKNQITMTVHSHRQQIVDGK